MINVLSVVTVLLGNKSYTVGKPVYFRLNGATFVMKMHLCVEQQKGGLYP